MSYAIMRIQKIKSYQALAEREKHNTRSKTVLNADDSKNIKVEGITGLAKHVQALEKQIDSQNARKTRKDAVKMIEILFTSDKKFFKHCDSEVYFAECKKWLQDTFGDGNILQISTHFDEEVEHLHCILTTLRNGKFNYSSYVNGRQDLRALQDSFYQQVQHLGLKRGRKVEQTKSTYQTTKDWHKNIQKARSYAEKLSKEQIFDYALKAITEEQNFNECKDMITDDMIPNIEDLEL